MRRIITVATLGTTFFVTALANAAPQAARTGAPQTAPAQTAPAQTGTPQTGGPQAGAPQTGAPQTGAPQTGAPQTGAPRTGAPQTGAPQAGAPQIGSPNAGAPQTGSPQPGASQTGVPQTGAPQQTTPATGTVPTTNPQIGVPPAGVPQVIGQPGVNSSVGTSGITTNPSFNMMNTTWFNNNAVQQQLNLNNQQSAQLGKIYGDQWTNYLQQINNLPPGLSNDQRMQQTNSIRQNFFKNLDAATAGIFTTPDQRQRFNQLNTQYMGLNAFSNPNVAQQLNLDATQIQRINQLQQNWNQQLTQIQQQFATDPTTASKRFADLQQQNAQNINSVLTPGQQTMWQQITGTSFNFQPTQFFPAAPFTPVVPNQ